MTETRNEVSGPAISLRGVVCSAQPPYDVGLRVEAFALAAGELALVRLEQGLYRQPLADVVTGVLPPEEGTACCLGQTWADLSPDDAAALRSRIGRVFEGFGWLSNLDLDENMTLPQRYHRGRSHEDVLAEAVALAAELGLHEVPALRPAQVPRQVLALAAWVRAFLGAPDLIVLERPCRELHDDARDRLAKWVRSAQDRGAGVIWTVSDPVEWKDFPLPAARWTLRGGELTRLEP